MATNVPNRNKVPLKQWKRWSEHARGVFNSLYETMMGDSSIFLHPKAPTPRPFHWKTTCWNASWIAADAADAAPPTGPAKG